MSNFLLIVMHLFKRSLYFSSNFCCSSICLLRSQFAYEAERTLVYLDVILMNKPCTYTARFLWINTELKEILFQMQDQEVSHYLAWLKMFQYLAGMPFLMTTQQQSMFADVRQLLMMQKWHSSEWFSFFGWTITSTLSKDNTNDNIIFVIRFILHPTHSSKIYLPLTNRLFFPPSSQGLNF